MNKKDRGQFYTTNAEYILDGLELPLNEDSVVIEPFAGQGDLLEWLKKKDYHGRVQAYDIEPKCENVVQRDTLKNPVDYKDAWIITNPPYLARNKCANKEIYDQYQMNDLYKCFLQGVIQQNNCKGGIFIIPSGFFFSTRDMDIRLRDEFMTNFQITMVKYFEERVFEDTSTTIVAFSFVKSSQELHQQDVLWEFLPTKDRQTFHVNRTNYWVVGGEIYHLAIPVGITIRRHVEGHPLKDGEQQTHMTLNALDSGTEGGRICLEYKKDYVYPAKDCSRTYATIRIQGRILTEEQQMEVCKRFNDLLEKHRMETHSLFLPQFRESKEYARKRIPFELAYRMIMYILIDL